MSEQDYERIEKPDFPRQEENGAPEKGGPGEALRQGEKETGLEACGPRAAAQAFLLAQEPEEDEDCLCDDDFDSRYIWDEYKKVLYEALPEGERKGPGFAGWLRLGVCALALALAVAGWLRGGKLLLPVSGQSHSILSAVQAREEQPEPAETAEPDGEGEALPAQTESYVATAILIDGKAEGVLASQEAAYALVEEVKNHFSSLAREKGEGELSVELMEEVAYRSAEAGEETQSYETLLERFTGSKSPLRVKCTLTTETREEIGFKTTEEKDKYLLEGTGIVVSDGRPGAKVTITHTVYINGAKSSTRSGSETQTIKAQDRVIRKGAQAVDPEAEPGRREGKKAPETTLVFQSPMAAFTVALNYGQHKGVLHQGLDYVPKEGASADVLASCGGIVSCVMERGGYGLIIEIDHGEGFTTRYAHLESAAVELGEQVQAGQVIGRAGQSGNAQALHLHFEVRVRGEAYNPRFFLD